MLIMCIKALMKGDYGFHKIIQEPGYMNRVLLSLLDDNARTRHVVLQILTHMAADPSTFGICLDAIHSLSSIAKEKTHFETILRCVCI